MEFKCPFCEKILRDRFHAQSFSDDCQDFHFGFRTDLEGQKVESFFVSKNIGKEIAGIDAEIRIDGFEFFVFWIEQNSEIWNDPVYNQRLEIEDAPRRLDALIKLRAFQ